MHTQKIHYHFKSTSDIPRTTWEIADFISSMTSYDYKNAIHTELAKILASNSEISMRDIVIFQNNFSIYKENKQFNDPLHIPSDIEKLLSLGIPTSFIYNKPIDDIASSMLIYYKFNSYLKENLYDKIQQKHLKIIHNYISNDKIRILFLFIADQIIHNIKYKAKHSKIKQVEKSLQNTKKLTDEHQYQIDLLENFKQNIDSFKERIADKKYRMNRIEAVFKDAYSILNNKPQNNHKIFEETFISLSRPIIAIFDNKNNSFNFICRDYIVKDKNREEALKLKLIKQNTPIEVIILSILGLLSIATSVSELMASLTELESKKIELETKKTELITAEDKFKAEKLSNQIKLIQDAIKLQIEYEKNINQIKNPIVLQYFKESHQKIVDEFRKSLDVNDMKFDYYV